MQSAEEKPRTVRPRQPFNIGFATVALLIAGCSPPLYEISLNNLGTRSLSVTALEWGEHQGVYDARTPIRITAIPPGKPAIPGLAMTVSWRIPERVSITWEPDGLTPRTREFELRRFVEGPNSYRSAIAFEFEDEILRVYLGPTDYKDPRPKALLAELR